MKRILCALGIVASMFVLHPAQAAEKITPSHVYQVVDNVVYELELLLDANFSNADVAMIPANNKRPRHVIQGAQEVLRKISVLKQINGLTMGPIAPLPIREITPADVKTQVDRILKEVRDLRPVFKITKTAKKASLQDGKTPSDVYARMLQASAMIDRLDIPAIVPNDVYRLALAIVSDVKQIHASVGSTAPAQVSGDFSSKKPPDVYAHGHDVLVALKGLVEQSEAFEVAGGIAVPPKKEGKLVPADVLEMLNTILAELSSLKVSSGAKQPTPVIPPQSGKTPGNVYEQLEIAMSYVQVMKEGAL